MRELMGKPGDMRRIVSDQVGAVTRLGTIEDIGRGWCNVYLGSSAPVRVIVPDQIPIADLVAGKRILCVQSDRGAAWVAVSTLAQPDRYGRTAGSASAESIMDLSCWGPTLTSQQILRGFKDDFYGYSIDVRWQQRLTGAGSAIALESGGHGGQVRLTSGPVATRNARLQLGYETYPNLNLNSDPGFVIVGRWQISSATNIRADMFGCNIVQTNVQVQADTAISNYWHIRTRDDATGVDNYVDSAVSIDTEWHTHAMEVRTNYVAYWLDKVLICSSTTKVPDSAHPVEMSIRCLSNAAESKYMLIDFIHIYPAL